MTVMAWADSKGGLHDGAPPEGHVEKDGRWYSPEERLKAADERLKASSKGVPSGNARLIGWIIASVVALLAANALRHNDSVSTEAAGRTKPAVADAACDYLKSTLSPSDSLATAKAVGKALASELTAAQISQLTSSCESDVDPSLVMGLAGRGPFAAMFTLHENGPCERGEKFRGTVEASSNLKTASWSVEIELDYASSRVTEYTGHAYIDVEPGETMAWDIWLPSDVTTVGSCETSIVSVRPS